MNSKIAREKAEELRNQQRGIAELIKTEKRNMTEQEIIQFDSCEKERDGLLESAETFERCERVESESRGQAQNRLRQEVLSGETFGSRQEIEERNKAVCGWLFHGTTRQQPEFWRAAERQNINVASPMFKFDWLPNGPLKEKRGTNPQLTITPTGGGNLVQVDNSLMSNVEWAMKKYGSVFNWAHVIDTSDFGPLPYDMIDDTSNVGVITPEGSGLTVADMAVSQNLLHAWKISTMVKLSWELEISSVLNFASEVGARLGERINRAFNALAINTGTGSQQPTALLSQTTLGETADDDTTIAYQDLVDFYHSVDPDYRAEPSCGFVFSDSFYAALRSLTDGASPGAGRPLLTSSLQGIDVDLPERLMGKPMYINQAVPGIQASAKVAAFGALDRFKVRRVMGGAQGGVTVSKLVERYADSGLVAYLAYCWLDTGLADAGQHPIRHLAMHA